MLSIEVQKSTLPDSCSELEPYRARKVHVALGGIGWRKVPGMNIRRIAFWFVIQEMEKIKGSSFCSPWVTFISFSLVCSCMRVLLTIKVNFEYIVTMVLIQPCHPFHLQVQFIK